MYQNQLFFDDFQKVFKVKIVEQKSSSTEFNNVQHSEIGFWLKRLMVRFHVQYMFH